MAEHLMVRALFLAVLLPALQAQTVDDSGRVVRFDPNIVQVDAVVTDSRGGYLTDLKAEDFRIQQDGKTRKIGAVSYVADTAQNHVPRTLVFLINDGDMLPVSMVRVREILTRFADGEMHPGDQVALLTTMGGLNSYGQFLPAGPKLHAAIADLRWRPAVPQSAILWRTLELLRRTLVGLAEMPGRKSIIVFSDHMLGESFDLRAIADTASRASVVVHVIDPRSAQDADTSEAFLPALAAITGGLFRKGGVDLEANLRAVMADQAGYYVIAWDPGAVLKQLWSWPVYHRVAVKAVRTDLTVRSRDGFFGVSGPVVLPASASKTQQMLTAIYTPLRVQQVHLHLTPVLQHKETGAVVQALIHVSSGIELKPDTGNCFTASLSVYASLVRLNSSADPALAIRGAKLRLCGDLAARVRDAGVIAMVEQPIDEPGQYQLYVGVRNGTINQEDVSGGHSNTLIRRGDWKQEAAQLGTAAEFIDVPTLDKAALPPLQLRGLTKTPVGAGKASEILFRTPATGDPAIREFHPGDELKYESRGNAVFQLMRDGEMVDSGAATGTYRLKDSLQPGHYVFEEKWAEGSGAMQWTDFRLTN